MPDPLNRYVSFLPSRQARTVVLLADDVVGSELAHHMAEFRDDRVVVLADDERPEWRLESIGAVFRHAPSVASVVRTLTETGAIDILVNLRRASGTKHVKMWNLFFFHLRAGGVYIVSRASVDQDADRFLSRLLRVGSLIGARKGELHQVQPKLREYAQSVDRLVIASDYILVTKRHKHMLKARDNKHTSPMLRSREKDLRVATIARLPGGSLKAEGEIKSYGNAGPVRGLDAEIRYPPVFLRRYDGKIGLTQGAVAFHGHTILPDSFRWHKTSNPINPRLVNVDAEFARLRSHLLPNTWLEGDYFFFDYSNSGHFGHLMTEAIAKLWGWSLAKEANPDLRIVLRRCLRDPDRVEPQMETRLLTSFGVAPEDIVWVEEPVWVNSLVGASPMWHNKTPYYAHPEIRQVWDRLHRGIAIEGLPSPPKFFVSRRARGNRACRNTQQIEELFISHGFSVVRPEVLDLGEQATLFSRAEVVAGFGGSGLFNLMYARNRPTLIVLSHEAYDSRNEHLFAAVLGLEAHYFWSEPDIAQPSDGFSYEAFQSSWQFDFSRNGGELDRLLRSLG